MISPNDTTALAPRIVRAGTAQHYSYLGPGTSGSCLIDAQATGGAYSVMEGTFAPGAGVPPHIHSHEDETIYVLGGTFAVQRADKLYTLTEGMALHLPRQIVHALRNVGQTEARLLAVSTPGGFENFFADVAAGEAVYGDLSTTEAQMQFGALMGRYGMTPAFDAPVPTPAEVPAPQVLDLGNHSMTILISSEETGGALLLLGGDAEPQGGPPPHVHHAEEEAFYIVRGQLELMLGDTLAEVGPGDLVYGPRNVPHGWRNIGDTPAYGLGIVTPGAPFQSFALEMEQLVRDANGTPLTQMTDPTLLQRLGALFQKYHLAPALPTIK